MMSAADQHETDIDGPGELAAIGLSAAEEAAYELLVDRSPATLADLSALWQRDEPLADALAGLESRDLVGRVVGSTDQYTALPPDVALDALLLAHEQQVRAARAHIDELASTYHGHTAARRPMVVERLTGAQVIERRLAALCRSVHSELRWLARPESCANPDEALATVLGLLGRDVTCRSVYQRDALEDAGLRAQVDQITEAGGQARVSPSLPTVLYLADDRLALLPTEWDGPHIAAALVVYPGSLLDALVALFEAIWKYATPIRGTTADSRLVELLLSGSTDVAVARQLGVGYRTVARRVAELMADLGAHTRFQAGVQAAFRDLAHPDQK